MASPLDARVTDMLRNVRLADAMRRTGAAPAATLYERAGQVPPRAVAPVGPVDPLTAAARVGAPVAEAPAGRLAALRMGASGAGRTLAKVTPALAVAGSGINLALDIEDPNSPLRQAGVGVADRVRGANTGWQAAGEALLGGANILNEGIKSIGVPGVVAPGAYISSAMNNPNSSLYRATQEFAQAPSLRGLGKPLAAAAATVLGNGFMTDNRPVSAPATPNGAAPANMVAAQTDAPPSPAEAASGYSLEDIIRSSKNLTPRQMQLLASITPKPVSAKDQAYGVINAAATKRFNADIEGAKTQEDILKANQRLIDTLSAVLGNNPLAVGELYDEQVR